MKAIPREVQVCATNSQAIRSLRLSLTLSQLQQNMLIGSLLGDGCLVANSWKKHYRLMMVQSHAQKAYIDWKYKQFEEFTLKKPVYKAITNSWSFRTISHPELTKWREIFYPFGKKIIPENINDLLRDPISIAIWYMDDGSLSSRKDTFILNTQSFTFEDNVKLQKCLLQNFGIVTTVNRDKIYYRLYINKISAKHFESLVKRHVTMLMSYKLLVTL